jgi:hypothetical protein
MFANGSPHTHASTVRSTAVRIRPAVGGDKQFILDLAEHLVEFGAVP